ncbi:GNAT family N-acetyltransferase [Dyadobacter frigoris]|uniref:GNAT family N-acetyltransferase n=1 Tax=Dyadobacter frigoris TaxID=2576211 RepID=A0A4U6D075_9BACT|nr:GNAT family N-acetyltransferase [Dyadobacter frigoris]TKT89605.1 GNAT family N-acetyltransferase [Dyadobacter frigoris]GLU54180.1 hypothetical protein Dfri01_36410 [Dyadobacter frigoris]
MLHKLLFPKENAELFALRYERQIADSLRLDKQNLEVMLNTMKSEIRVLDYFKRVLLDDENLLLRATYNHHGRFALITTRRSGYGANFHVFQLEEDWKGGTYPREACKLWYTQKGNETLFIDGIESRTRNKGAGSVAMEMLIKEAIVLNITEISGKLCTEHLKNHADRLIGFYEKFGFKVTLHNDKPDEITGEVLKKL